MSENRWLSLIIKEEEGQWYLFPFSSHGWVSPSWCALVWLCFCTWVASSPSQAGFFNECSFYVLNRPNKKQRHNNDRAVQSYHDQRGQLQAFRFNTGNNESWGTGYFISNSQMLLEKKDFCWSPLFLSNWSRLLKPAVPVWTTSGWSGMVGSTREQDN